jgi:hypothetical protein
MIKVAFTINIRGFPDVDGKSTDTDDFSPWRYTTHSGCVFYGTEDIKIILFIS